MTVPAAKTSLIDPIVANDFNWPRTNIYVGANAFDTSPTTGQRCWRNDRGIEYYYDGTRWLSTQIYQAQFVPNDNAPFTQAAHKWQAAITNYSYNGFLVTGLDRGFNFNTAQSATNFYGFTLLIYIATGASQTLTPANTSLNTSTGFQSIKDTFSNVFGSTYNTAELSCTVGGAPGTFYMAATLSYRLIG